MTGTKHDSDAKLVQIAWADCYGNVLSLNDKQDRLEGIHGKKCKAFAPTYDIPLFARRHERDCNHCNGSGRMVRDQDIGTDQECFVCEGEGKILATAEES